MFQSRYEVRIEGKDVKSFIKKLYRRHIYIENITYYPTEAYLILSKGNYEKLKKIKTIYKVEVTRLYGFSKWIDLLKRYALFLVMMVLGLIYLFFLSHVIFKVEVIHSKKEIRELLTRELQKYGIEKYRLVVDYETKEKIESKILKDHKTQLEWLEIKKNGVYYEIRAEERILNPQKEKEVARHIVAKKDGIIMRIQASQGEIVKKINDYVKKGDVIISGLIKKDEQVKNQVAAAGEAYAEVWYQTKIEMPFYYKESRKTGKKKKTLKFSFLSHDFYLFNWHPYQDYEQQKILSLDNVLLPISFSFSQEEELLIKEIIYTKEEAIAKAEQIATKKLESQLSKEEKILSSKILKVEAQEDKVEVVLFYKVYENIATTGEIIEAQENEKSKNKS